MATELELAIHVVEGKKIGLRINNANLVCAVHPETAAAAAGLRVDDLVVVRTDDAILVCPRERAQDVRSIVARLEAEAPDTL